MIRLLADFVGGTAETPPQSYISFLDFLKLIPISYYIIAALIIINIILAIKLWKKR